MMTLIGDNDTGLCHGRFQTWGYWVRAYQRRYTKAELEATIIRRAERITADEFRTPATEWDANYVVELALELI